MLSVSLSLSLRLFFSLSFFPTLPPSYTVAQLDSCMLSRVKCRREGGKTTSKNSYLPRCWGSMKPVCTPHTHTNTHIHTHNYYSLPLPILHLGVSAQLGCITFEVSPFFFCFFSLTVESWEQYDWWRVERGHEPDSTPRHDWCQACVFHLQKLFFRSGKEKVFCLITIHKCFPIIQPTFKVFQMPSVIEAV